jgi:hypothetical protein
MFRTPVISLTLFCLPLFFGGTRALGHGDTRLHTGFGGSSQPRNIVLHKPFELWQESDSLYWLTVNGVDKAGGWRLPYPVYQFQTGDVDGDGSEDAMVGVVKATRYWPLGRRLFIFKQIDGTGRAGKPVKKVRPLWLGSKLGGTLEDFRYVAPAEGDSMGRIRALESTADSLYAVSDYKWGGFGMKFDRLIIKGVDRETALRRFYDQETAPRYLTDK